MEDLKKAFRKKFDHKKIVGMKLMENGIGSYKFVDFRSEVKSFIRQREKELLEEIITWMRIENGVSIIHKEDWEDFITKLRKELSNE